MSLPTEELTQEQPSGELVHWMTPGRTTLGTVRLPATALAGFVAGIAVALGALAAVRWLAPRREGLPPWKWRRGALH